jgi:ABC-2 type transport system permease protein
MIRALILKLLRDMRWQFLIVALLLGGYECLMAKVTQRVTEEVLPEILKYMPITSLQDILFERSGKIMFALVGGPVIDIRRPLHILSIGYMNPEILLILSFWALARSSGAIAGEIDRGTMELLLAQPLARSKIIVAHLLVDLVTIPPLCLAMWAGTWLGVAMFGTIGPEPPIGTARLQVDPMVLLPALPNVAALVFAMSGVTIWLSTRGRFRFRVLGTAVVLTIVQFIVNLIGQLVPGLAFLRPFTLFYYFQPQQIVLQQRWTMDLAREWRLNGPLPVNILLVLSVVGVIGYLLALWTFNRRDVPAPL